MSKEFFKILNIRMRKSNVKRYEPVGETTIKLVYNTDRNKPITEVLQMGTEKDRNAMIETLDALFL